MVTKKDATARAAEQTKAAKEEKVIAVPKVAVYAGVSDVRIITAEDLRHNQGLDYDGPDLVWHAGNRFAIDLTGAPTSLIEYLDVFEPSIVVKDGLDQAMMEELTNRAQGTQPSGRFIGAQASQGKREFPAAHPEAVSKVLTEE